MKLTETIVKRPVAAVMIIIAIVIFGFSSLINMPQQLTPEMEMPMLIVYVIYPGAGPEDVEQLVTKEIESSAGSLSGVKTITSQSMENISLTIIQYEYGTNMDTAYTDVKERLDRLANTLPDDTQSPIVMELDMNAMATMYLSVISDSKENLLYYVEDEIVPELERLSAVTEVSVSGGREEYIRVEVMEEMLQQYNISVSSVIAAVGDVDFSMPLGSADHGSQELAVRTEVKYNTVEQLRNIPISTAGSPIRLSDVANIYEATKDASSVSRYNGMENISLSIQKRQSSTAGAVSTQVQRLISQLMAEDPDIEIAIVYDSSQEISDSINSVIQTMALAIVLSMAVLFVFLGDFKASLIVGSSMPVSLLVAFIFMDFMGFSLNVLTLGGLVLGVGMMVDNAIVVIDSCFKHNLKGRTFIDAAIEGTRFVMLSIIASTITTVVVFLPLAMISGLSGQLFGPLGFTVVFSLIASLISAITLVPLFFVQFKPVEKRHAPAAKLLKRMERGYGKLLKKLLKKKKTVMAVALALIALSLVAATGIRMELMPSSDSGIVSIDVETRPGLKLEKVEEIMLQLEEMVGEHPDVEHYTLSSGGGSLFGSANSITAYLDDKRGMETAQIVQQWQLATANMVDCDISISSSSSTMSMSSGDDVDFVLEGTDLDNLREANNKVLELMEAHPQVIRSTSTLSATSPQAEIVIDPLKAADKNLTPAAVSGIIYTVLNGNEAAEIRIDEQVYSIWVEYPRGKYDTVADLENMQLSGAGNIPLSEIATITFTDTPQTIIREDGVYMTQISATPLADYKWDVQDDLQAAISELEFPSGVSQTTTSSDETMMEEFAALGGAILTAIFLVFMVMAIQFESVRHSVMVMICIPFSLIGSLGLLYIFGLTISMVSLLGFLILVGTVVNNGILFVDTTNQYRQSMDVQSALIQTGRTRLRPILMTTLTTVLSMIPLAVGMGSSGEMMQGMGVTVIGGLTASTLLTLLLLPTFYLLIDGNPEKRANRKKRRHDKRDKKAKAMQQKALSHMEAEGDGPIEII